MGGNQATPTQPQQLPWVVGTTLAVVGLPMAAVSLLRISGVLSSTLLLVVAGTVLSILASRVGAVCWASSNKAGDTVFGDLMLWGWLRRRRSDRQISSASALFAPRAGEKRVAGPRAAEIKHRQRTLQQLATTLEARDPATQGHSRRVARHAAAIAKRMGLPADEVSRIRAGAALHDVGKISTPVSILNKSGKLTDEEFAVIQQHPVTGAEAVSSLGDQELAAIVRHHHERIDGHGYPDGLKGQEIPIGARIVAVADTFDAITSPRPYRAAKRHRDALLLLDSVAGTQLDAEAVRAFRSYYSGLRALALWALALHGPRQLLASLFDQAKLGNLQVTGAATAATVATVVATGVAVHSAAPTATASADPIPVASSRAAVPLAGDLGKRLGPAAKPRHSSAGKPAKHDVKAADRSQAASSLAGGAVSSSHRAGQVRVRGSAQPYGQDSPGGGADSGTAPSASATGSAGHTAPAPQSPPSTTPSSHVKATPAHHIASPPPVPVVGAAAAAAHATLPETAAAGSVTVPEQAQAIGFKTKANLGEGPK